MKDVKKLSIFQENSNTGKWTGLELFQVKISVDAKGTSLDSHTYNQGRLGLAMLWIVLLNNFTLHNAVQPVILDAYYHQPCYLKFTYILKTSCSKEMVDEKEEIASIEFWTYIRIKVINEKNAHLLKETLEDAKS